MITDSLLSDIYRKKMMRRKVFKCRRRTGSGTPPNRSRTWTARSTAW